VSINRCKASCSPVQPQSGGIRDCATRIPLRFIRATQLHPGYVTCASAFQIHSNYVSINRCKASCSPDAAAERRNPGLCY